MATADRDIQQAQVDLVRSTDSLMKAKRAMGGLIELVLSAPDDKQMRITRGNLYNLLEPIETMLSAARDDVEAARKTLKDVMH